MPDRSLPKYECRWALAANSFSEDWSDVWAPNARMAAEQLLERADALGKVVMPSRVFVEVKVGDRKPLRFEGHAGLRWSCQEMKKWDARSFNKKGVEGL